MMLKSKFLHPTATVTTAPLGRCWRVTVATCAALLAAACVDSYPTDDAPNVVNMTQSQRLDEMNEIGDQAYLDFLWRYELLPACQLKVVKGTLFTNRKTFVVPFVASKVVKSFDRADKTYDVHLKLVGQPTVPKIPVFEGGDWVDTTELISLLKHVQRDCATLEQS